MKEYYKKNKKKKLFNFDWIWSWYSCFKRSYKKPDLQKYVIWIPKQKRIEIFKYIEICDIGVSEFAEMFWGDAVGISSSGKPFFHHLELFRIQEE